ncbi:hypothetical protein MASR2M70_12810 [Bacillota bacterium]
MGSLLSISKIHKKHLTEHPDSILSERAIRQAVKSGTLPVIWAGNRALICDVTFDYWIKGGVHKECPGLQHTLPERSENIA